MKIRELIRNLGLRLGIADLELSEDGSCSVTFGPDEVIFEQEGEMLFIIAEIGSAEGNEKIFRAMLDANHCGHGSGFGSIGWDCERNSFTLSRVIEGDFNNELFEKQLKLFVSTLRFWKLYLIHNNDKDATAFDAAYSLQAMTFLA